MVEMGGLVQGIIYLTLDLTIFGCEFLIALWFICIVWNLVVAALKDELSLWPDQETRRVLGQICNLLCIGIITTTFRSLLRTIY